MVNLFACIQCMREVNSHCTTDFSSLKSDPYKKQFVSSANNLMIIFDRALWISFMKIRNSRGPSTEP